MFFFTKYYMYLCSPEFVHLCLGEYIHSLLYRFPYRRTVLLDTYRFLSVGTGSQPQHQDRRMCYDKRLLCQIQSYRQDMPMLEETVYV